MRISDLTHRAPLGKAAPLLLAIGCSVFLTSAAAADSSCPCFIAAFMESKCTPFKNRAQLIKIDPAEGSFQLRCLADSKSGWVFSINYTSRDIPGAKSCDSTDASRPGENPRQYVPASREQHEACKNELFSAAKTLGAIITD